LLDKLKQSAYSQDYIYQFQPVGARQAESLSVLGLVQTSVQFLLPASPQRWQLSHSITCMCKLHVTLNIIYTVLMAISRFTWIWQLLHIILPCSVLSGFNHLCHCTMLIPVSHQHLYASAFHMSKPVQSLFFNHWSPTWLASRSNQYPGLIPADI